MVVTNHLVGKKGLYSYTCHAEECVLNKMKNKLPRKTKLIVIRINNKCELIDSKPCVNCINKLKATNIKKVIYSNNEGILITEKIAFLNNTHMSYGFRSVNNYLYNKTIIGIG